MSLFSRPRSLLAHSVLWVMLPFVVLTTGLVIAAVAIYQQSVTSLIVDRDRQVAHLAAASVSEGLHGYERVLTTLAGNAEIHSSSATARKKAIESAGSALSAFNAGVLAADLNGQTLTAVPVSVTTILPDVARQDYFQTVLSSHAPAFSHVFTSPVSGEPMIVIAVPITGDNDLLSGVLLGAVDLRDSTLDDLVKNIIVGYNGEAYLVGQRGTVIYHPNPAVIGTDYSNRPSVAQVEMGFSGGLVWQAPDGRRYVDGYAPIRLAGWGLIVQESWDQAAAPTQAHFILLTIIALTATGIATAVLWLGVRQITTPVQVMAGQTSRLAAGDTVEPVGGSGIAEFDALARAFNHMAAQIATYRAGLRRYVGAITDSQEEERLRISRELHDETVQSLMAVGRRIELHQASEDDPRRRAQLEELHTMVDATVDGVRQISRDLRPLILDDLGLVPALRMLVRGQREGEGAVPSVRLDVTGTPVQLTPEQELALYRITQEALNNVRRHAHATSVSVTLAFQIHAVQLDVTDDGRGFTLPTEIAELAQTGHFGLMGIQERVWAAGGTLVVNAGQDRGVHISVMIPVDF